MSKQKFKPGDRVMTNSTAHESYYGTVSHVAMTDHEDEDFLKGDVFVRWDKDEDGEEATYENPRVLTHAPKLPVKMVRVGWLRQYTDGSAEFCHIEPDYSPIARAYPVYAKKEGAK